MIAPRRERRSGVVGPEQTVGQQLGKAAVNLADALRSGGPPVQATLIDPLLDGDVGSRLQLQFALFGLGAVVVPERALDIDRVRIVPLDQVAVVAVHRPHETGEGADHAVRQAVAQARRPGRQLDRKVREARAMA
jgi:hypothetical protein